MALHRLSVLVIDRLWQPHHMQTGRGHVINIQKITARFARAPDSNTRGLRYLRLVEATDQRGDDVAVFWMVVVARAIEVGGHNAAVVHSVAVTVLAVVTFTELDASDFGNGIGSLVGSKTPVSKASSRMGCAAMRG